MATISTEEKITSSIPHHCEQDMMQDEPKIRPDDINDGDVALEILHTHYEPYTPAEEKRLLRKIDFRLAVLMLVINGI